MSGFVRGGRSSSVGRSWLDKSGCFLFGKHEYRMPEDVMRDDPEYIRWVVEEVEDVDEEDREVLSACLAYRGRGRGRG